ncbi:polysaccharide biosynthesis/export family protein [Microcoleus vaginatus]|uniref:polysaccharide biosynthesis/export family protein n=1 Tax=Microcoleus vaginatus TaxID=119532 RepID=UPI0032A1B252
MKWLTLHALKLPLLALVLTLSYPQTNLAQSPGPATIINTDYYLGGGDNIRIDIYDLPQLSGEYQIPAGGAIQIPIIGSVPLQGLTLEQAAQVITRAYGRVVKRPLVTISLQAARPLNIWLSGEVSRPGSYSLPLANGGGNRPSVQFPTLPQALEKAGGIRASADIRRVIVRRRLTANREITITYNLWDYLQTGQTSQDITLRDGDQILVPPQETINLAETNQLSESTFSIPPEQPRTVSVFGEVKRPGRYVAIGGDTQNGERTNGQPTIIRALQLAGGITSIADIRQIQLQRYTRSGKQQVRTINLWQYLQEQDTSQDTILQEGDIIFVPTATAIDPGEVSVLATASFAPGTVQVSVIGEVNTPGGLKLPPNTTLNQAIMSAGGFRLSRANSRSVELIRLNPNGTISRSEVAINLNQGIDAQTNPLIQDNDIIIVGRSRTATLVDTITTVLTPVNNIIGGILVPTRLIELLRLLGN